MRNWLASDDVAIIDIHIYRAGLIMGLYNAEDDVRFHYSRMEARFIDLTRAMGVRTAELDSLIWSEVRESPRLVRHLLQTKGPAAHLHRRPIRHVPVAQRSASPTPNIAETCA